MSTKSKINRPNEMARDQQLITGLTKHAGIITMLYVNGQQVTPAQAITTLQGRVSTGTAVAPAKTAFHQAIQADRDERAQTKTFVTGLRQALLQMFAGQPQVLADLGIEPPKKAAPRTTAEKQAAAARAKNTRAMRHTVGPKAKAKIQAPPVPVEPATAQTAPEPPVAVAAPAPTPKPQS